MWIDDAAMVLRRHLTSEIAKRRAGPGRRERSVTVACSICGTSYERARQRGVPICNDCRRPKQTASEEWDAWKQAWLATIPPEELDELAGALALLR